MNKRWLGANLIVFSAVWVLSQQGLMGNTCCCCGDPQPQLCFPPPMTITFPERCLQVRCIQTRGCTVFLFSFSQQTATARYTVDRLEWCGIVGVCVCFVFNGTDWAVPREIMKLHKWWRLDGGVKRPYWHNSLWAGLKYGVQVASVLANDTQATDDNTRPLSAAYIHTNWLQSWMAALSRGKFN